MNDVIPTVDGPIHLKTIDQMTDAELDARIELVKVARLKSFVIYQQAQDAKQKIREERDIAKLNKKLKTFKKQLDQTDKYIAKLENYALEVRAMRLSLGILTDGE